MPIDEMFSREGIMAKLLGGSRSRVGETGVSMPSTT